VNRIPNYIAAFLILLSLAPCAAQSINGASTTNTSPKVTERTQPQELYGPVVAANNQFAVRFFKAAYEDSSHENVLTAPASLSYAFALLLNGSIGPGRDQIAELFDLKDVPLDQTNQGNAALRAIRKSHLVKKPPSKQPFGFSGVVGENGRSFQPYTMAGALWVPNGAFTRPFLSLNTNSYGYTVFPLRPTPASINQWASRQTHGKLNNIVQDIGHDDFVLATVVDFKSRWLLPFSPSETHSGDFILLSGAKKQVRMMPKYSQEFQYLKGPKFQAVELYFYDAAMVVVLPDEDSTLQAFVDALTPDTWQMWSGQFGKHDGYLELPRFEIKQQRNSKLVLDKLGLTLPFSDLGTFIPMVGLKGAILTRVQEGVSMKVDETGAEILSYGIVGGVMGGVCGGCPPPPPPFHMIVDRPFFFWIVDTRTNQTLYMGTVVEP
jgi:serine protease inhibitor